MDTHSAKPVARTEKDVESSRDEAFSHPEGGEALLRAYSNWEKFYETDVVIFGYCGPQALASVVPDIISDTSSRILDAASGTGLVGKELKTLGFTCIDALDPSQSALELSKRHRAYTEFICDTLDAHQTKIPHDRYDAVVMCGAFGIPGHVTTACFPELIRITKPGGYIMFTVSTNVLERCQDEMESAIQALSRKGFWELLEYRRIPYVKNIGEQAKVPILKVLKK